MLRFKVGEMARLAYVRAYCQHRPMWHAGAEVEVVMIGPFYPYQKVMAPCGREIWTDAHSDYVVRTPDGYYGFPLDAQLIKLTDPDGPGETVEQQEEIEA